MRRKHGHFSTLSPLILQTASYLPVIVFLCLSALTIQASDPLFAPSLQVELGPEQIVAPGAGWPYLFQSSEGTTVVLGHVKWIPKSPYPIHFTVRSFDERKTWEPWTPGPRQGAGPMTEGVAVQMKNGHILIFDVYAEHLRERIFQGKRWISRDGWRTVSGPESIRVSVPKAEISGVDDRGEPISRLYIRRSVLLLPGGDLLASAYGRFDEDMASVEYLPKMKQTRSYLVRSSDEGMTWTYYSTIAVPPIEQEGFGEPVIVQLKHGRRAGRLICQMRTGRECPIYQAESDDEGKTWTKPRPLRWTYSRFGRQRDLIGVDPDLIEISDGTLVMSYGHKPDYQDHGNFLAFSLDQGETWTSETRLNSSITMAYTGVREVSPGVLFVAYTNSNATQTSKYREATFDTVARTVVVRRTGK
jgi:BNR repeat-like domain